MVAFSVGVDGIECRRFGLHPDIPQSGIVWAAVYLEYFFTNSSIRVLLVMFFNFLSNISASDLVDTEVLQSKVQGA
jgi:hypothetical protein